VNKVIHEEAKVPHPVKPMVQEESKVIDIDPWEQSKDLFSMKPKPQKKQVLSAPKLTDNGVKKSKDEEKKVELKEEK
jgi:hypothetical protein